MDEQQDVAESDYAKGSGKKGGDYRYYGKDSRKGGKAKEKRDGNWEAQGRRAESKKEAWKERRGKQQERFDSESNKLHGGNAEGTADQVLNGGHLLSMLKANPPSVTRYSREELLSIGQLPASKVKPAPLDWIIDKENHSSPLLVRPKVDKVDRPSRNRESEKDQYSADANGTQRHWPQRGEEADDPERQRGRNRWSEDRGQRWKDGYYEDDRALSGHHQQQQYHSYSDEWQMPSASSGARADARSDDWDMPDANDTGDLMDFTLGDIRKAEKAINKGMAMSDYKASFRAGHLPVGVVEELGVGKDAQDRSVDPGADVFFAEEEEDEDVSRASRGFGKWFGKPLDKCSSEVDKKAGDLWDMPTIAPSGGLAALPSSTGLSQGSILPPGSTPSPASTSQHPQQRVPPSELPLPRSPGVHPVASSIEKLLDEADSPKDDSSDSSNQLGKSILSMLGRTELASGEGSIAEDPAKQAKLTVSELFHLAQGKELPPIPPTNNNTKDEGNSSEETDQHQQQRQYMAQMAMWMNAVKAGQPQRYNVPHAFGVSRPSPGGPNPIGGRGASQDLYSQAHAAEAYAQALRAGRGVFPMNGNGREGKGSQASWASQVSAGYPYSRGQNYSSPSQYGAYAPHDYSHLSSGIGGYDVGNAQAALQLHSMYSGSLGAAAEGQAAVAARSVARPPVEKANSRSTHLTQASALAPRSGATAGMGGLDSSGACSEAQDANEEDSGCSQS